MSARKPPSGEFPNLHIPESVKRAAAAAKAYHEALELGVAELKPLSVNEATPVPREYQARCRRCSRRSWTGLRKPSVATDRTCSVGRCPTDLDPRPLRVSFSNIPHRKWLYGTYLIRGEITVLAAPGGAGKTALANGIAIEVAAGREKLGEKIWKSKNQKVLYFNGEDSRTEIERRLWAFCRQHNVAKRDIGRLYVAGADDARVQSLSFLSMNEKGTTSLDAAGFGVLESALQSLRPDLLVLDPLVVFCGGGNMNDNAVMSLVMRKLKALAANYDCAILIVHHTRKGGGRGSDLEGEAEAVSGAAAIVNLARHATHASNDDRG